MNSNDKLVFNYIRKFGPDIRTSPLSKRQALNFLHNYPHGTPEYDRLLMWAKGGKPIKPQLNRRKATETSSQVTKDQPLAAPLKSTPNKPLAKTGRLSSRKRRSGVKKLASFHLPESQLTALKTLAEETGESMAFHVREALSNYLPPLETDE